MKKSKTDTSSDISNILEPFSCTQPSIKPFEFERKHRIITITDSKLGDIISINCEKPNQFELNLIPFRIDGIPKQLAGGDIYIKTIIHEGNH